MTHWTARMTLVLAPLIALASPVSAQATHRIAIEAEPSRDLYRFSPSEVKAKPGDVLVFRAASGAPHSVVFEAKGLTPAVRELLNNAMPSRTGDLSGPLLTRNGAEYRIKLPEALPAGTYEFYCLPHRAYDTRGRVTVGR